MSSKFTKTAKTILIKDIPIVMLAATRHYDEVANDAGVDRFILKPFDIDHLLRQVDYYLSD